MSSGAYSWKQDRLLWPSFFASAATVPGLLIAQSWLSPWLPPAVAAALGIFAVWAIVGIVLSMKPPIPNWSLLKWLAASAGGAIVGGITVFLLER